MKYWQQLAEAWPDEQEEILYVKALIRSDGTSFWGKETHDLFWLHPVVSTAHDLLYLLGPNRYCGVERFYSDVWLREASAILNAPVRGNAADALLNLAGWYAWRSNKGKIVTREMVAIAHRWEILQCQNPEL